MPDEISKNVEEIAIPSREKAINIKHVKASATISESFNNSVV